MNQKDYTWSYNREKLTPPVIIEHTLKYGDVDEIKYLLKEYGYDLCKKVWIEKLLTDARQKKLNYFLGRFIFRLSSNPEEIIKFIESNYKRRFDAI